jgi:hypothetical protein
VEGKIKTDATLLYYRFKHDVLHILRTQTKGAQA